MTTIDRNFLGIAIDGDITDERKDQRPREEFEPFVKAVLDDPLIDEFGWRQYTPYFNDGDTCIFGAHAMWVRTTGDAAPTSAEDEDDDEYDPDDEDGLDIGYGMHPVLGGMDGWGKDARYVGEHEESWRRCRALSNAVDSGEFDAVLLSLFGDHASVKVRRDGITVQTYEHD